MADITQIKASDRTSFSARDRRCQLVDVRVQQLSRCGTKPRDRLAFQVPGIYGAQLPVIPARARAHMLSQFDPVADVGLEAAR